MENPSDREGRGPGSGRAPVPSWATPGETWRAGFSVWCSNSGSGRYIFYVGKSATC